MDDRFIWAVILGMAASNFVVRLVPIAIISRLELPRPVMRWLSFVPIAVMGTLVAGEVFRPQGEFAPPLTGPHLWASAITAAIYWRSRSFLGATLSGMIAFVALRALLS